MSVEQSFNLATFRQTPAEEGTSRPQTPAQILKSRLDTIEEAVQLLQRRPGFPVVSLEAVVPTGSTREVMISLKVNGFPQIFTLREPGTSG